MDLTQARWRKSSLSSGNGDDNCVEVALVGAGAALRDSKNSDGPVLVLSGSAWAALADYAK